MDEQRYPVNIRLVGVMHLQRNKLYMTTVLWSDQNEITVYRSLKDFQNLHRQLKKKFPSNPMKRSERIVPKFKAVRVIKNMQKWNPSKSVLRLKALDEYCTELLKSDARISQSPELMQFIQPNPQDLNSDLRKNSIVIMPSETSLGTNGVKSSAGDITQPFVTEMYRCLATYETKDTKNRPFKVKADEIVDVLIKDKGGWWLVENESKNLAWFPAPYLVRAENDDDDDADVIQDESVLYVVSRSYKATNSDEISVQIGAVVEALQKSDNGWWLIRYNQKAGYIPSMYLQPYNNPLIRITPFQKEKSSSTLDLSTLQAPGVSDRELSKSQGNLYLPSGTALTPGDKQMSHSLAVLRDTSKRHQTPPSIRVEFAESGPQGSLSDDSDELSFSDDGSSSCSDSLDRSFRSYTPTSKTSGNLSPDSAIQIKMTASISDPCLTKMPGTPKVPPRPKVQEILNRCTTVTCKNLVRTG
ncbi:NADPH oxidase organizer 1a [Misgurnus anguillicaudatus]|uniref:NADPH oxidase organizer 1a n=1 Tax=Misgurnus anguillicaudatus TaxID=75329 RepID=UPI003CCF3281